MVVGLVYTEIDDSSNPQGETGNQRSPRRVEIPERGNQRSPRGVEIPERGNQRSPRRSNCTSSAKRLCHRHSQTLDWSILQALQTWRKSKSGCHRSQKKIAQSGDITTDVYLLENGHIHYFHAFNVLYGVDWHLAKTLISMFILQVITFHWLVLY